MADAAELAVVITASDLASDVIEHFAEKLGEMGPLGVAAGVGLGAVAAGATAIGKSVEDAAKFDAMLTQIQNNTTMTDSDVQHMHDAILQLASDSGSSFDALGEGFQHIVNLSGDATGALDVLKVANESAVSTGGDVAETANVLANVMHEFGADTANAAGQFGGFNSELDAASHYMGVMHLAAAESNMTLEQFSESAGQVYAWAAPLGVSVEQASAAFASMTKHGFDAAEAGTQVKDLFEHLIKPSQGAAQEIADLGQKTGVDLVSDFTATGLSTKGLTGILGDLQTAMQRAGLSQAQIVEETMKLLPNIRGGVAGFQLLTNAAGDYDSILGDLNNDQKVNEVTADSYARTQQQLQFQTQRLGQEFNVIGVTLGERLLPVITPIVQAFADALPGALDALGVALSTLQPALDWLGQTAWPAISQAAEAAMGVFQSEVVPRLSDLWQWVQQQVGPALQWLADTAWPAVQTAAGQVADFFQGTVEPVLEELQSAISDKLGAALTWLTDTAWPNVQAAAQQVASFFQGTVEPAVDDLRAALDERLRPSIDWMTNTGFPNLGTAAESAASKIRDELGQALDDTKTKAGDLGAWKNLQDALDKLKDSGDKLRDAIDRLGQAFHPASDGADELHVKLDPLQGITDYLAQQTAEYAQDINDVATAIDAAAGAFDKLAGWLQNITTWADNAGGAVRDLKNALQDIVGGNYVGAAQAVGQGVVDGFSQGLAAGRANAHSGGSDLGGAALQGAREAVDSHSPSKAFMLLGEDIGDGLNLGILASVPKAKAAVDTMGDSILSELQTYTVGVSEELSSVGDQLDSVMEKVGDDINQAIMQTADGIAQAQQQAQDSITAMYDNEAFQAMLNGQKDALTQAQARGKAEMDANVAAQDATWQHQQSLNQLKRTLDESLAKATTQTQKDAAQQAYQDGLQRLKDQEDDQQAQAAHQQQMAAEMAKFQESQARETAALNEQIQQEQNTRQEQLYNQDRDNRIRSLNDALTTKEQQIETDANKERQTLLKSLQQRVADLHDQLVAKIPDLTGEAQATLTAFLSRVQGDIEAMTARVIGAANDAAAAVNSIPSVPSGGGDGQVTYHAPGTGPLSFDAGGVVPGPVGAPMLAIVHGGERFAGTNGQRSDLVGSGGGVVVQFNAPVYGFSDFKQAVATAADQAFRSGQLRLTAR